MPTESTEVPRAVTPVGVVAELVTSALNALGTDTVDAKTLTRVRSDLGRASAIASGLDDYLSACTTPESVDLRALAATTAEEDWGARRSDGGPRWEQEMLSGHVEGAFLRLLVRSTQARRVLELGMFTGYSALAMAEALPADGRVIACEVDPGVAELARASFSGSAAGQRIDIAVGPALDTLASLRRSGEHFDLVFVDADKAGYAAYLDVILDGGLLAADGLICVDNTLLQGEPWTPSPSAPGRAIAAFNAALAADPRVEQVVVPLRDGVTLVRWV